MSHVISFNEPLSPLESLLSAYNLNNERERIEEAFPFGQENLYLVDVLNVMARMGYMVASLKTRLCDIDARLLPCAFVENKTNKLIRKYLRHGLYFY
jgi:hypothetical protein